MRESSWLMLGGRTAPEPAQTIHALLALPAMIQSQIGFIDWLRKHNKTRKPSNPFQVFIKADMLR